MIVNHLLLEKKASN